VFRVRTGQWAGYEEYRDRFTRWMRVQRDSECPGVRFRRAHEVLYAAAHRQAICPWYFPGASELRHAGSLVGRDRMRERLQLRTPPSRNPKPLYSSPNTYNRCLVSAT